MNSNWEQDLIAGMRAVAKWRDMPKNKDEADMALLGKRCLVCGSSLLLATNRPPIDIWKVHCNHCATEMPIAVLLNREAWKSQT